MSDQTYNVKYNIEVESTVATQNLNNFTRAVESLSKFKDLSGAVGNVKEVLRLLDSKFKTDSSGKGRRYEVKFNINTKSGEAKLGRILTALETIEAKAKSIHLVVNPGKAFDSRTVKRNAKQIIEQSEGIFRSLAKTTGATQTSLSRSLGKINASLAHLTRERELTIKTDVAKARLEEILFLLGQVRTAAAAAVPLRIPPKGRTPQPARTAFVLPPHVQQRLAAVLPKTAVTPPAEKEAVAAAKRFRTEQERAEKAAAKAMRQRNVYAVRGVMRTDALYRTVQNSRQRAAINRLQYSRPPSLRNTLPFAYMLNGYMLYDTMRSQLIEAGTFAPCDAELAARQFHGPVYLALAEGTTWPDARAFIARHLASFQDQHRAKEQP